MAEQTAPGMVTLHLMGQDHQVPAGLTIMAAIEYVGYKLVRGSGCRAGFCGACPAIYRLAGDAQMHTALACQTLVTDGMSLVQVPFVPVPRQPYDLEQIASTPNVILEYYPEVARCIACNTCSRACPQQMSVMDYIQAALRGDIARVAELSFDCIQCGICSSRCPVDIKHPHVAQLARRIYGRYFLQPSPQLATRLAEMEAGSCAAELDELMALSPDELKAHYAARTFEHVAGRDEEHSQTRQWGSPVDPVDYQDDLEDLNAYTGRVAVNQV